MLSKNKGMMFFLGLVSPLLLVLLGSYDWSLSLVIVFVMFVALIYGFFKSERMTYGPLLGGYMVGLVALLVALFVFLSVLPGDHSR